MTGDTGRLGWLGRVVHPATTFLVPMIGIVELGWQLDVVLVLYWLGVGTTAARLSVETTFAARPNSETGRLFHPAFAKLREKRGGIPTPGLLPRVYPHGLPAAFHGGSFVSLVWTLAGAGVVVLVGPTLFVDHRLDILLGAAGVGLGELLTLGFHLRRRPYAELSPSAVFRLRNLLAPGAFLLLVLVVTFQDGGPADAQVPVVLVVYGQTVADVIGEFGLLRRLLPAASRRDAQIGDRPPVPDGDGPPRRRWRTDRRSVVCARMSTSPARTLANDGGLLAVAIAVFVWIAVDSVVGNVVAAGLILAVGSIGAVLIGVETDLLYGHLEYRLYDDCLVAYDRLLDTPQWRVELRELTETESSAAVLDRLPGLALERLFVRTDGESRRLVGLADAEGVRERIDEARFE